MIRERSVKAAERHLKVVETLALGGRRQLLLVTCDGERFLVGSSADRVESIVRIGAAKATEDSWV
jgi:flagellar biogenesis protein FliO